MILNELSIICRKFKYKKAEIQFFFRVFFCAFAPLRLILFIVWTLNFIIFLFFHPNPIFPQYIPVHPQYNDIYSFLDEFSIQYNTAVKPFSRHQIYELLKSIDTTTLSSRQKKELVFYLKDFSKEKYLDKNFPRRRDLFYYRDSSFSFTVNPILGSDIWSNKNGFEYYWWNGAEAWVTIGKWGIYGSMRDNHESSSLTKPGYLNQNPGGSRLLFFSDGKVDYEEIMGGITYSWKTGSVGLIKDNFEWGTNYKGSNIFSGRNPAFVHIDLNISPVKWFQFHYIHGWLNSNVIDSSRSFYTTTGYGTRFRSVYHKKFMAANMFTFYPLSQLAVSAGNSIIYDFDQVHPVYLIPVMFFKAVDHNLNNYINNMNSQMFIDISSKNLDHFHFYSTLFLDELSVKRITQPDQHNFASYKGGIRIFELIPNSFAGFEYTISNALVFKHNVSTTTFESNQYNLGHYLTDNAKELFLTTGYKPYRNLVIELSFTQAIKGPDHNELGTMPRETIKSFTPEIWKSESLAINASWQPFNDLYLRLGYEWLNVTGTSDALQKYTPEFWWGKTGTINIGVNYGF